MIASYRISCLKIISSTVSGILSIVQVSFVGQTEEAAREAAQAGGYSDKIKVSKTSFKANSKVSLAPQIYTQ